MNNKIKNQEISRNNFICLQNVKHDVKLQNILIKTKSAVNLSALYIIRVH